MIINWMKSLFETKTEVQPKIRKKRVKLSKIDRAKIIQARNAGITARSLARRYEVHISTIYSVLKGK